jgi:hypothetical protein
MSATRRGLLVAILHVALVAAVAGTLFYERATLPRAWVESAGVDPDLPIRGRYVALNLLFAPASDVERGSEPGSSAAGRLEVRGDRAFAATHPTDDRSPRRDELLFSLGGTADAPRWMLVRPVAFFLPQHAPDPTRGMRPGELWVEVTIPREGPPRPIRLGVLRDGAIRPLP